MNWSTIIISIILIVILVLVIKHIMKNGLCSGCGEKSSCNATCAGSDRNFNCCCCHAAKETARAKISVLDNSFGK